jgi:hypothetical protein
LFLSEVSYRKFDLDLASELCQTVGDELFTYHIILEVDKTQDLPSKI